MSYFPIFADLNKRPVLIIGAGEVAERKVEALLTAGALVSVIANKLNQRFQQWLVDHDIRVIAEQYHIDHLNDHLLVIAATDNEELNKQISQDANLKHIFCNVVDNLALCSYITPARVDRGPIQIAISSSGTAPVLARKIKLQIEQLIPLSLGKIATFSEKLRPRVKNQIRSPSKRRLFWERLFDSPYSEAISSNDQSKALSIFETLLNNKLSNGHITLVGAGPGDPGLLTLHALQAISDADIIFYDYLVSDQVMQLVRKDSTKICVGKKAHGLAVSQSTINQRLIEQANQGKRVVRLKGGDPFIFGRGGEECQEIINAGISYRVIPGITAAMGASTYAGIPLTHRDYAQTVLFITGHCRPDGMPLDWSTLARQHQTLAIYMGTLQSAEIQKQLIKHGQSAETPVAIISNGTLSNQTVKTGLLNELASLAENVPRPAMIIIGEVVKLHQPLNVTDYVSKI